MKKTILLSSILAVGATFADPASVTSANAIGALDVEITDAPAQKLIAVPFVGYGIDGAVAVKDIVKTSNLAEGSKLYVPDGKGTYNTWTLNASGEWGADAKVTVIKNGVPTEGESANQSDATINRGDSFWLEPKLKEAVTSGTIYLLGQMAETAGTSSASAGTWNLIGNASVAAVDIAGLSGDDGDQIVVQNGNALIYYTYNSVKEGWCKPQSGKLTKQTTLTISAGQGFWYKPASAKQINWSDIK